MKKKILAILFSIAMISVLVFAASCASGEKTPKGNSSSAGTEVTSDTQSGSENNDETDSGSETETDPVDDRPDYTGNDIVGEYRVFMNNMTGVHTNPYTLKINSKLEVSGTTFGETEVTGFRGGAGVVWIDGKYTYYNGNGLIVSVVNKNYASLSATDCVYIGVKNGDSISEYTNFNSHRTKLVKWTMADRSTLTVFVYGNSVYTNVTFESDPSVKSISSIWNVDEDNGRFTYKVNTLTVYDSNGKKIETFANNGSDLKVSDGYNGTYAFLSNGMLNTEGKTDIYLNGVGGITVNDKEYSYTIDKDRLTFNGQTVILDKENMTYHYVSDGFGGTYKNGDDTLTLDGYGTAILPDGNMATYEIVSGMAKIISGGVTYRYNLDVDALTYSEYDPSKLPAFAGWSFTGHAIPSSFIYDSDSEDDEEYYGDESVVTSITFSTEDQTLTIVSTHWSGYKYIDITASYTYDVDNKTIEFTHQGKTVKMKFSSTLASLVAYDADYASVYGTGSSPTTYCFYHIDSGKTIYYVFSKQ